MAKEGFAGFPRALPKFLAELSRNNQKKWFDAHRADYEAAYVEPAKQFVQALAAPMGKLAPGAIVEPRINGSIMRINRDTRFSKDKSPYKNGLHLIFADGGRRGAGFYVRIAPKELAIAAGAFGFDPDQLKRFRAAVVDPKKGKALRAAVAKIRRAGHELCEPDLKTAPRGFDPDHPNAEYLRYKGFYAQRTGPIAKEIYGPEAVAYILERFREMRPVQQWVANAIA